MADFALQRKNMVESQVRPSDVTDRRIMRAMQDIPRECYFPPALRPIAYMDENVTIAGAVGQGPVRQLLAPRTLAKLVQLLEIGPDCKALDVATGNGYSAALLARLAKAVVALECDADLAAQAQRALSEQAVSNVTVRQGNLADGALGDAPFDAILVNGAVPEIPASLLRQLKPGGRMAIIVANGNRSQAMMWQRTGEASDGRAVFDAAAAILPGFAKKAEFAL
jgi:protein-L-isoaspartate(D-aspartate) O-methyltransferase